ncbi:MAG: DNA polymerase III subunit delta [Candidatus Pacebacteria bacterium]|nr:DNA polymerase III subunit delta [Candidatus Paceibacterota bacterium]
MIYFLYGKDTYRMKRKLTEIISRYKKSCKCGLNLKHFDFSENYNENLYNLVDEIKQISIFKQKKLLVLINPSKDQKFKSSFLEQADKFIETDDIIVIYEENDIDKKDKVFKLLQKSAKCQEFVPLSGQKLRLWVIKEFERYGLKINHMVLERIINLAGNDLWRLASEIHKLAAFCDLKEVNAEDVDLMVRSKIEADIFKTIDAVSEKNKKQALRLIKNHLDKGDSPLYLLSMINYQFRNILLVKELVENRSPYDIILSKTKLHPYVAKKSYFQSQRFSFPELKKIYQKIFEADLNAKTGRVNPETALDMLISEI